VHPNITDVAQRHGQHRNHRLAALEALAATLRARPLNVVSDLRPRDGAMPLIALRVRPDYCGLDQVFIDATLRDAGWTPNAKARSTLNAKYDCRALVHTATGAELLVVITLPFGEVPQWEAA
jgi:hypothetical protein